MSTATITSLAVFAAIGFGLIIAMQYALSADMRDRDARLLKGAGTTDPCEVARFAANWLDEAEDARLRLVLKMQLEENTDPNNYRADLYNIAHALAFAAGNMRLLKRESCRRSVLELEGLVMVLVQNPSQYGPEHDRAGRLTRAHAALAATGYLVSAQVPASQVA